MNSTYEEAPRRPCQIFIGSLAGRLKLDQMAQGENLDLCRARAFKLKSYNISFYADNNRLGTGYYRKRTAILKGAKQWR